MTVTADLEFLPDAEYAGAKAKRRPKRLRGRKKAELRINEILTWADAHYRRTGGWPNRDSGTIFGSLNESWCAVDLALQRSGRGLPGKSSLAQLLAEHRGVRNRANLPRLTRSLILQWADAYKQRNGTWPIHQSGPVVESPGETWLAIDQALRHERRGLRGRSSLARLLAKYRGKHNVIGQPKLTVRQILYWADAHNRVHGHYPKRNAGSIAGTDNETWARVANALVNGLRGLPGGSSLAQLLAEHRNVRTLSHDGNFAVDSSALRR